LVRIAVVDGQGGGIGTAIIKRIREHYGEAIEIWALGTNAIATSQMLKAGANRGATGDSAVRHCVPLVDFIAGPISIVISNSMMGELTPAMAKAIGTAPAMKLLLPLTQEAVRVVGATQEPLPHLVDQLIAQLGPLIAAHGATPNR
jgi:hypothetical protein